MRRVKATDENSLNKWIDSVREIHTSAPAPSVQYSGPVPDIEKLMEAWPSEIQVTLFYLLRFVNFFRIKWQTSSCPMVQSILLPIAPVHCLTFQLRTASTPYTSFSLFIRPGSILSTEFSFSVCFQPGKGSQRGVIDILLPV